MPGKELEYQARSRSLYCLAEGKELLIKVTTRGEVSTVTLVGTEVEMLAALLRQVVEAPNAKAKVPTLR